MAIPSLREHRAVARFRRTPVNVLWVCGSGVLGGAEHATMVIAEGLLGRGMALQALVPPGGPLESAAAARGLVVTRAPLGGAWNFRALRAVARALRAAPDVALVTTSDEWVWASLAPRPRSTRLVLVRHMAVPLAPRVSRLASRRADRIVAVSRASGAALVAGGVDARKIVVIPNASRFDPAGTVPGPEHRQAARQALDFPGEGRLIGFFGGLREEKGIRDVLAAFAIVREAVSDARLVICGGDLHPERVRAFGAELDRLGAAVHRFGETGRVLEVMTACDVVVLATRDSLREAFPLTVLEAMACGTPVVASDTGGVGELIGDTGRRVRPGDTAALANGILASLTDLRVTAAMASAALERVRVHFSRETIIDQWEGLLRELDGVPVADGDPGKP